MYTSTQLTFVFSKQMRLEATNPLQVEVIDRVGVKQLSRHKCFC